MKAVRTVKIEQFKPIFEHGKTQVTCRIEGSPFKFYFDKKKMGFGYRHYFICSTCGKYCVELVQNGGIFACFGCAGVNPYRGIANLLKNGLVSSPKSCGFKHVSGEDRSRFLS